MMLGRGKWEERLKWQQQAAGSGRGKKGRKNSRTPGKARTRPAKSFAAELRAASETAVNATLRRQGVMVQKVRSKRGAAAAR